MKAVVLPSDEAIIPKVKQSERTSSSTRYTCFKFTSSKIYYRKLKDCKTKYEYKHRCYKQPKLLAHTITDSIRKYTNIVTKSLNI